MKNKLVLLVFTFFLVAAGVLWWGHKHAYIKNTVSSTSTSKPSTAKATSPQSPSFNKQLYPINQAGSLWWVVNKQRPLSPTNYAPADLVAVGNGQTMRKDAAAAFTSMLASAKQVGYNLSPESGYRSYATQTTVYNREIQSFGQAKADTESARPGYSEHQTGWAVDIGSTGCYEDCFGKTAAAQWLVTNAYKSGFILRYPDNKAAITGYRNEPWHFRYVGKELAAEMQKTGQVMEEFFGLPPAPTY